MFGRKNAESLPDEMFFRFNPVKYTEEQANKARRWSAVHALGAAAATACALASEKLLNGPPEYIVTPSLGGLAVLGGLRAIQLRITDNTYRQPVIEHQIAAQLQKKKQ